MTPELSLSQLKEDHSSYPTNHRQVEPIYQAGFIERFGTGPGEIYWLTEETGLRESMFDLEEGFKVINWRLAPVEGQATGQATGQVTGQVTGEATGEVTGEAPGYILEEVKRVVIVLEGEMKRSDI